MNKDTVRQIVSEINGLKGADVDELRETIISSRNRLTQDQSLSSVSVEYPGH